VERALGKAVHIRRRWMRRSIIEKIMISERTPFSHQSSRFKIENTVIRLIRNVQKIQFLLLTD